MITMCPCSFINCNKCATVVKMVMGGGWGGWLGGIWDFSVLSVYFCCDLKLLQENKSLLIEKRTSVSK